MFVGTHQDLLSDPLVLNNHWERINFDTEVDQWINISLKPVDFIYAPFMMATRLNLS